MCESDSRSPGRARRKPLTPLRAGMPGDPGATVVANAYAFYFCIRGCGCVGHPAFPTPSGVEDKCKTPGASRRGNVETCVRLERRHCEERSDEAINSFFAAPWIASLRSQ